MRLALLVLLGLSSTATAQQMPAGDPTPPPIDRSVPNSGTSRSTDDAAKPTERDGSLTGSTGSSSPSAMPSSPAPLGPNDPKAPAILNGKESTRMSNPKAEPGDAKPDR